jgi:tetratricopeptide (TPR) repeat protein
MNEKLRHINDLLNKGFIKDAIDLLENYDGIKSVDYFYINGLLNLHLNNFEKAQYNLTKCIYIDGEYGNANYLMGLLLNSLHEYDASIKYHDKQISITPNEYWAYVNRGNALINLRRYSEGIADYETAIRINEKIITAHINKGNAFQTIFEFERSIESYDKALTLQPTNYDALLNKSICLFKTNSPLEALTHINKAEVSSNEYNQDSTFYTTKGLILLRLERLSEAFEYCNKSLEIDPNSPEAWSNLGAVKYHSSDLSGAIYCYDKSLQIDPHFAKSYSLKGNAFILLKNPELAFQNYDKAIELDGRSTVALLNRALLFIDVRRYTAALNDLNKCLEIDPKNSEAKFIMSELLLLTGDFLNGWFMYESRWQTRFRPQGMFNKLPIVDSLENIRHKKVLITPEVGFGDFIMFSRYIELLLRIDVVCVIYTPKPLVNLFSSSFSCEVLEEGCDIPNLDYQCPIMSFPRIFGTTLGTIPLTKPYIKTRPSLKFKSYLKSKKRRIGIVWANSNNREIDKNPFKCRSISLDEIKPLFSLNYEFHCLQNIINNSDLEILNKIPNIITHLQEITDFEDTALLINDLDFVISIDTSVAHLAGALGKKMLVLVPYSTDYRWISTNNKSNWYQDCLLFKQEVPFSWVIIPFCKGVRSRNVTQPWPVAALV